MRSEEWKLERCKKEMIKERRKRERIRKRVRKRNKVALKSRNLVNLIEGLED
jgi:hypothetical protein